MTAEGTTGEETLLCDTSYLSQLMKAERHPNANDHWPPETVERINRAVLTISVFTLAEIRQGMAEACWGERKQTQVEDDLRVAYTWIPLDPEIVSRWVEIQVEAKRGGVIVSHNDVWIAATAAARGFPLVSCDVNQCELPEVREQAIYLPAHASSRNPT